MSQPLPFIEEFWVVTRLAIARLVLDRLLQMGSRWKALNAFESMGPAASVAATMIVM